jgi:hypothetical protein
MIYCKKLDHIPDITLELKNSLIEDFKKLIDSNQGHVTRYCGFETSDKNNIAYISNDKEYTDRYGISGGVSTYQISKNLQGQIINFFKKYQKLERYNFAYVSVDGGDHIAPHTDDKKQRREFFVYLVNPGNPDTKTIWYEPKEEFKDFTQTDGVGIPYDRLVPVEEHVIETGCWYLFKGDQIHSVEKLGQNRFWISTF